MRKLALLGAVVALALASASCQQGAGQVTVTELNTFDEKVSYAFGLDAGRMLSQVQVDVDIDSFVQGVQDGWLGNEGLMTPEEINAVREEYATTAQQRATEMRESQGETNAVEGAAFLEANKMQDGVMTTASGLQYMVIEKGDGPKPSASDRVTVHYRGTLIDGSEFDSSYSRGQPATFPVSGVIPGWVEGLQLMNVGGKYKFFIPSELAYGERGAGQRIGPNAVLIFEVELLEIAK